MSHSTGHPDQGNKTAVQIKMFVVFAPTLWNAKGCEAGHCWLRSSSSTSCHLMTLMVTGVRQFVITSNT